MRVVFVTVPPEQADRLAETVVQEKLAACASLVGPVASRYWWKGRVETAQETLIILKTSAERAAALVERVRSLHPYEVPEILCLDVAEAHPPYKAWVRESCRP